MQTTRGDYVVVVAISDGGWVEIMSLTQYGKLGFVPAWILQGVLVRCLSDPFTKTSERSRR